MPNQKQPIGLLEYKGRKHLTKDEIAQRHSTEVDAPADNVVPPKFLNAAQKEEFNRLADELIPLGLVSNLDTGELERYVVALTMWEKYTKQLRSAPKKKASRMRQEAKEKGEPIPESVCDMELAMEFEKDLVELQTKYFNQCETCAKALGLNITARCRLIIPKATPAPPENKFSHFQKQA